MAKFETNLSKKDKQIIAGFLGLAVAFAFGWYLIRPAIIKINTLNDDISQASITEAQYRAKIINLSSAEAIYGRAVSDLNDSTSEFYEVMQSSSIDRMMTNYVLGFGLFPEDLTITMPNGPVEEVPYIHSEAYESMVENVVTTPTPTPIGTVTLPGAGTNESEASSNDSRAVMQAMNDVDTLLTPYNNARNASISTSTSGVECVTVSMVMSGSPEACQALIDDLCKKQSVRLTGFEWMRVDPVERVNQETGEVEFVDVDMARLRVNLNLYMVDIVDYESAVDEAVEAAASAED